MKKLLFLLLLISNISFGQCTGAESVTLTPAPPAGGYTPGTIVTVCYTMNGYTMVSSNWCEGFAISLGTGWINLTPISAPVTCGGSGGTWIWENSVTSSSSGLTAGPGYFFDLNNNGNSGEDFGDVGSCSWICCFEVTVSNACTPQDLSLSITNGGDGTWGSWGPNVCGLNPFSCYNGMSNPLPVNLTLPIVGRDTVCYQDLSESYSVTNTAGYIYTWSSSGIITSGQGTNTIIINWSALTPGLHNNALSVYAISPGGCLSDTVYLDIFVVKINPIITPVDPLCQGANCVQLNGNPLGGTWSGVQVFGNQFCPINAGIFPVTYSISQSGCIFDTTSLIIVSPQPSLSPISLSNKPVELCPNYLTSFNYSSSTGISGIYTWTTNWLNPYIGNNYPVTWSQEGIYEIEVCFSSTVGNCRDTAITSITVIPCSGTYIYIPNTFTPNGDGLNDYFIVNGLNINNFNMVIYDRWGELLFQTENILIGWDGTYKTNKCQQDIYIYVIRYNDSENKTYQEIGHINLLR